MAPPDPGFTGPHAAPSPNSTRRRLIVNADDFGRSPAVNSAVLQAHQKGILTSASLMVSGDAAAEAAAMARDLPRLGVGLHLTLIDGHALRPPPALAGLVQADGRFDRAAIRTGWRYFWNRTLRAALQDEITAQIDRFHATGLVLDHVNGHWHMHLHPVVFSILMQHASAWGLTRLRLTRDPFWLNARLAGGHWLYRISHALIFSQLARRAKPALLRRGIKHADAVFGLLQNGRVNEAYWNRLLARLPEGDFELYCHPSGEDCERQKDSELAALLSPRIRSNLQRRRIELIRYQDL